MKKRILVLALFISASLPICAQVDLGKGFLKDKKSVETFTLAEYFFDNKSYLQALPFYSSLDALYGTNTYLLYKEGICQLYKSDEFDKALEHLLVVKSKNSKAANINLFLAHAYHLNERYDEAMTTLDLYDLGRGNTPENTVESARLRQNCIHAKEITAAPVDATISNLGAPINTGSSEYVPIVSADDSLMIFTYKGDRSIGGLQTEPFVSDSLGEYFEDVFFSSRYGGSWKNPEPMDSTINGFSNDACITISNDGQTLLIFKDEAGAGDIYSSKLVSDVYSEPIPLSGEVNSMAWEGSACFSPDMQSLYFASERDGGYGGRDIWVATKNADNYWGNVKNLGPNVNTLYNEDSPYLHANGVTMFFSSEGHNSMGGYDVFRTKLTPIDSTFSSFSAAINLGYPINSPGDEKYFILATDGKHGYYSSGKKGGMGQQDIYNIASNFDVDNVNVMLLSGLVTMDGKKVYSNINIKDDEGKLRNLNISSKSSTGKYSTTLALGHKYSVSFAIAGSDPQIRFIDAAPAEQMVMNTINISFYSKAYLDSLRADSIARNVVVVVVDKKPDVVYPTGNSGDYNDALRIYGDATSPGLVFRVQIGAYNIPQNYKADRLKRLGFFRKNKLEDQITRITISEFLTLNKAEKFRQEVIAAGQSDAFVTGEKDGTRYLIGELFTLRFFQN